MNSLQELFSLRGHIGLVTGASSGLGVECARALAIAGADVVIAARRGDRLDTLAAEIRKQYGVRALPIAADITVEAEIEQIIARSVAELGEIDILINNAGVAPTGRAERISREMWESALALNLTAPMFLSQRVAARLIERRRPGRIINITSVLGQGASAVYRLSPYTAAKAGLANLTRQLAVEWAPYGINVNAISPGWIPTEATEGGIAKPGNREKMESLTPLGRLGLPEELRGAVIFLASPAGSYVTGSVLAVDGGYTAW
ncbi:MAG TPA: SDR family oxidoreductase [Candidatus Binataceae bacterium]